MAGKQEHRDPTLERAREEAAGVEVFEAVDEPTLVELRRAEDAQGVEAFVDPDSLLPGSALVEGVEGEETLSGSDVAPAWDDDHREGND